MNLELCFVLEFILFIFLGPPQLDGGQSLISLLNLHKLDLKWISNIYSPFDERP